MTLREYTLFLDESGAFGRADGTSCVAGLLVPTPLRRLRSQPLRDAILRGLPWLPWPLHACLYNLAGYHLALWMDADRKRRRDFPEHAVFDRLESHVQFHHADPIVRNARAAMGTAGRGEPDYEPIRRFDRWLVRTAPPEGLTGLREVTFFVEKELRVRLAALAAGAPGTVIVAAAAAPSGQPGRTSEDGYLSSLEALLERVECIVGRLGAGRVWPVFGVRDVDAGPGPRRLDATEVNARWERAVRAIRGAEEPAASQPWPAKPQRFDDHCHAGLVLADFVANRLFRAELDHPRSFAALASTIGASTGGAPEIGQGRDAFPTLAADGWPRRALTLAAGQAEASVAAAGGDARDTDVQDALARSSRGWRREQASACIDARCWSR